MSTESTLKERGNRYGSFTTHSALSQSLKKCMIKHNVTKWNNLVSDQKEALEMIQHKVARIINGDPDYIDNWHDIQGYAKLIEDRLTQKQFLDSRESEPAVKDITQQAVINFAELYCVCKYRSGYRAITSTDITICRDCNKEVTNV